MPKKLMLLDKWAQAKETIETKIEDEEEELIEFLQRKLHPLKVRRLDDQYFELAKTPEIVTKFQRNSRRVVGYVYAY